ncbi:primosomal protein N' [Thiocapsa imhoffii]|uniref:Replication restart protein PriA n=1 Tax=Thiocapsa imhoffii TaxID=382777 RepID=A0A9X0WEK9_9GAMM|nr:primosomal protein N' [Thiocapsa imhoffii]MBK1643106.1 primosomal protein N' [Thiocapsa imhoffii]
MRVAVAAPLLGTFDYWPPLAPCGTDAVPPRAGWVPGVRVLVPFGRSRRVGVLLELATTTEQDPTSLKHIERVLDPQPLLAAVDLVLIRWAADYYCQPLGEALFTALPVRLRRPRALDLEQERGVAATAAGRVLDLAELRRAPKQRALLTVIRAAGSGIGRAELTRQLGSCQPALRHLRARGLIEDCSIVPGVPAAATGVRAAPADAGPDLNPHQVEVVNQVTQAFGQFRSFLLEGVTGSGKTEVYIRLIQAAAARGEQTLLIVPEIGLTPQLRQQLAARLPFAPAVLHSGISDGERERTWHQVAAGRSEILLGTRSAIFTPLPRLGLILVDEEHDTSLKQQDGFRYSARDVAVRRAQLVGCPVVLGSATPALETLHNAQLGRYGWLRLPVRAGAAAPPRIALLDIRNQPLQAGLSGVLRESMRGEIASGNQVLLFLNRRGYAPVLTCHACGWVGECLHCDARLTLHLARRRLWCHHCGWFQPLPRACPSCGDADLRMLGQGTERLDDELRALFPATAIARLDRDTTRRQGELARLLEAVRRGEVQILLGTQMLAKGHDFPRVTLVGILDLDQSLYASDFRAPERTAQLIVQVTGRAGRAERPGRVVLQTRHPEHPLLQSLLRDGYAGFAAAALAERQEAELPPFSHLALLRAEAPMPEVPMAFLMSARTHAEVLREPDVHLWGPIPAPMERRAARYRAQLLVQSPRRGPLRRLLAGWTRALHALPRPRGLRWSLDIDPQDMS